MADLHGSRRSNVSKSPPTISYGQIHKLQNSGGYIRTWKTTSRAILFSAAAVVQYARIHHICFFASYVRGSSVAKDGWIYLFAHSCMSFLTQLGALSDFFSLLYNPII